MDLDLGIVAACLRTGKKGLKDLSDAGITDEMIVGEAPQKAIGFLRQHIRAHGAMPSTELFLAKTGVQLPETKDPLSVYIDEVRSRHLWNMQAGFSKGFVELVNAGKPLEAHEFMEKFLREVRSSRGMPNHITSIWSEAENVIQSYYDAKDGKMGIPTPWDSINEMTRGWEPGDFIVFAARLGIGKSFMLLMLARHAWENGYHVLFISPEMAKKRLAMRTFSMHLGFSYSDLTSGQLGDDKEKMFDERVREMADEEGFDVLGGGFKCTLANIEDAVAIVKPDILFIDGLYLVRGEGRNRSEAMADVANECKTLALSYEIPIVGSTQFNRDVKKNDPSTADAGSFGLSDVIGWNIDKGFALIQTDDMRSNKEMMAKPLKLRESDHVEDVWLNWDFERMDFSEQDQRDNFRDQEFEQHPDGFEDGGMPL